MNDRSGEPSCKTPELAKMTQKGCFPKFGSFATGSGYYSGAGNDFLVVDSRSSSFDLSLVPSLCGPSQGRRVDGVVLLQNDSSADYRMRIFNSDGSEAEGCGNGLRCLVRFIRDLGLSCGPLRIAVHDRVVETFWVGEKVGVRMGEPRDLRLNLPLYSSYNRLAHFVDTGVPHLILFSDSIETIDINKEASPLRCHPAFAPRGTNVNFACLLSDGSIAVRTFERGVEGETLACGTGATAVAVVAAQLFDLPSPILTRFKGGEIEISFTDRGLADLCMIGPVTSLLL